STPIYHCLTPTTYLDLHFHFPTPPTPQIYTLSLHDALPISPRSCAGSATSRQRPPRETTRGGQRSRPARRRRQTMKNITRRSVRSEEHTSELQSRGHLVCRLLLEKKKNKMQNNKKCVKVSAW